MATAQVVPAPAAAPKGETLNETKRKDDVRQVRLPPLDLSQQRSRAAKGFGSPSLE